MEVSRLKNDIPKYYSFLKPQSKETWKHFLEEELDSLTSFMAPPSQFEQMHRELVRAATPSITEAEMECPVTNESDSQAYKVVRLNALGFLLMHPIKLIRLCTVKH